MEIRVDLRGIEDAAKRMGATVREVPLDAEELDDIEAIAIELEQGIEVELNEVEANAGGLLDYKGHQVVLYIPDQGWRVEEVLADGAKGRKVHVANCVTLDEMRKKGRFERYVVRNGLSPDFAVSGTTRENEDIEGEAQLRVCQNCLKRLNYKNFNNKAGATRKAVIDEFSLDNFFATYSSYFKYMPRRHASDLSEYRYHREWQEISKRYREQVNWQCEGVGCGVNLSANDDRKLLHVHHINGVKGDNSHDNVMALCVDCHSKEDMHQHVFVSHRDRRRIQALRREQGRYSGASRRISSKDGWTEARRNADPAVHGLLFELEAQGQYSVPEVGKDVFDPKTKRIIYSNAELVWPETREIVVLEKDSDSETVEKRGWTVFTAQELLDELNN